MVTWMLTDGPLDGLLYEAPAEVDGEPLSVLIVTEWTPSANPILALLGIGVPRGPFVYTPREGEEGDRRHADHVRDATPSGG